MAATIPGCILTEANTLSDQHDQKSYRLWSAASQSDDRIEAMITLAKSEPELVVQSWQLDGNPYLLNVRNGTLNLSTRELLPHNPGDLITKISPVEYDPEAECPIWEMFMNSITLHVQKIEWVQQSVGQCLTGIPGSKIVHCFGPGGSGKMTFLRTVGGMLGEYARYAPHGILDAKNHEFIRSDLARLRGVRFVLSHELKKDIDFDEVLIKSLPSAKRKIVARTHRNMSFKFSPTHKLWTYSRYDLPLELDEQDLEDVRLIIFPRVLSREEKMFFTIETFMEELPGILNWAMRGVQQQPQRLHQPRDHSDPW